MTLVRARLWPATAQNPRLAFTFDLLDWAEALMYECHVALKDLWGALLYKFPHILIKVCCCVESVLVWVFVSVSTFQRRNIYQSLIDSFEEYR